MRYLPRIVSRVCREVDVRQGHPFERVAEDIAENATLWDLYAAALKVAGIESLEGVKIVLRLLGQTSAGGLLHVRIDFDIRKRVYEEVRECCRKALSDAEFGDMCPAAHYYGPQSFGAALMAATQQVTK